MLILKQMKFVENTALVANNRNKIKIKVKIQ